MGMTRGEAEAIIDRLFQNERTGAVTWQPRFADPKHLVDALVELGLLRLDQPKGLPQKMRDFVSDTRLVQGGVMERLDNLQAVLADHGLRIIEK
jgi:hypothetical protein